MIQTKVIQTKDFALHEPQITDCYAKEEVPVGKIIGSGLENTNWHAKRVLLAGSITVKDGKHTYK